MEDGSLDMIAIMLDELMTLLDDASWREFTFEPGTAAFHIGDPVSNVHFVKTGLIHLVRYQQDGTPLIIQRADAGSILAEASMFSDVYHCEGLAITRAQTWAVPCAELRMRIGEGGLFAEFWAKRLAHEVQKARLQTEIVSIRTVAARLDAWINWHGALPPKGEWGDLAAQIGVSREALYRELARRR